jgi:EAL domain-containing protein (putative c-di-GMP-specific phosphodiesterase class I)
LHYLGINAGLARCPSTATAPEQLFKHAGLATHESRRRGHRQLVEYSPDFDRAVGERQQLVSRLHEAIEKQEFELHFQPLYDAATRAPLGMEALIRWRHPQRGLVPPMEFIPVCEDSGLIVPLGRWVLREAARHHARLVAAGWPRLGIAVNVSALQFSSGELLRDIPALMREFALPAGFLELELTESLVMDNPEAVITTMRDAARAGRADLDRRLRHRLFLDAVPAPAAGRQVEDRPQFRRRRGSSGHNAAICESILALARSFNLKVIAEGVETQAQLDWLRAHGCDEAQGYLLAKPLPFEEMLAKLGTP